MKDIDIKLAELREITNEMPFIEYYSHESCVMYKIVNVYTPYDKNVVVLCSIEDGFEKAIDLAIEHLRKRKLIMYPESNDYNNDEN